MFSFYFLIILIVEKSIIVEPCILLEVPKSLKILILENIFFILLTSEIGLLLWIFTLVVTIGRLINSTILQGKLWFGILIPTESKSKDIKSDKLLFFFFNIKVYGPCKYSFIFNSSLGLTLQYFFYIFICDHRTNM